jgi:hypothetical protein
VEVIATAKSISSASALLQFGYFLLQRKRKEKETLVLIFKTWWQTQLIWTLGVQKFVLFVLGDMFSLLRNSDCIYRRTQLIWILSVHESVLFVMGNLLSVLLGAVTEVYVSQSV